MEDITTVPDHFENEILKVIYQRRAVRVFNSKEIDSATIEKLLDAGRMAPSAINKQPWHFYVVNKKSTIKYFSESILSSSKLSMLKSGIKEVAHLITHPGSFHLKEGMDFFKAEDPIFHGAPLVIFITTPKDNEWAAIDIGMCSQNMMLAAKSMGISSCPLGLAKYIEHSDVYDLLQVPDNRQVQLALIFGYSDTIPEFHHRTRDNVTYLE